MTCRYRTYSYTQAGDKIWAYANHGTPNMWWTNDQFHYPTYSSMNRALFFNNYYGNTTIHATSAPRIWGSNNTAALFGRIHNYINMWSHEHRRVKFDGNGNAVGQIPKEDVIEFGVWGYNLSAAWVADEGDVEPHAVPYAPKQVQCRYDRSEGAFTSRVLGLALLRAPSA